MGRLNKNLMDRELLMQVENQLFKALSRKEPGQMEAFLRRLMSEVELEMLGKRLAALIMIREKTSQSMIAAKLKLSTTTVSQLSSKLRYDRSLQNFIRDFTKEDS